MTTRTTPPSRRPPSAPRARRLLRAAALIALALVAGELGLRALGALIGRDRVADDPVLGEREQTVDVLFAGDSWTQGAPYGRYSDFLVRQLNDEIPHVRFRETNVGRAGTNSSQALRRLPRELADYHPDLLLVLTGNNDHHNLTDSAYWRFHDRDLGPTALLAARMRTHAHSLRLYRLGRTAWQALDGGPTANEFFEAGEDPTRRRALIAIDPETHRRQLEYNLTRFIEIARRERVPVVFQTYFHFHGYRVNEIIRDVATRHDIPLVDHNRLFHTEIPAVERESYRIADGHPNARGYAWMARNVSRRLLELELIP